MVVVVTAIALLTFQRNFWTPDTLFILLFTVFVVFGQARPFLIRMAPLLLLLLTYDFLRNFADDLNHQVHFYEMINIDRAWFGTLPTTTLQQWWWHGSLQWYDFYFYLLYTFHFLAPVLLALAIWKFRDQLYWPFVTAIVGLSFAAFLTYLIFPAAPPWMAAQLGYIEPVHRISSDIWSAMGVTNFSVIYAQFSNQVAAVPSLHAAYPLLFVLFLGKMFGWGKVWWVLVYPVSVWVGIVYLGEHYVVDAVLGIIYALLAYRLTMLVWSRLAKRRGPAKLQWAKTQLHR